MLKIPESQTGHEYATKENPTIPGEHIPLAVIKTLAVMPKYSAPTLSHVIVPEYGKIWTFSSNVPILSTGDIGVKLIKIPVGCDSILFMTAVSVLTSAGDTFVIHPNEANGLSLFGYVAATDGSISMRPEALIGTTGMGGLSVNPPVCKDLGGGIREILFKPILMPVCGFDFVLPVYNGISCADVDKPKVVQVKVWAVPVNSNYANLVI